MNEKGYFFSDEKIGLTLPIISTDVTGLQEEWGFTHQVRCACNVKLVDSEGTETDIPRCEKCNRAKMLVMGQECHAWVCDCECKNDH